MNKYFVISLIFLTLSGFAQTNQKDIIRDGHLSVEVADYAKARTDLLQMIEKQGGYVYNENESKFTTKITNELTIRILDKNYELLVADISNNAKTVTAKNAKLIDAPKELNDLYERRKLKQQVKEKYKGLLDEAKTAGEIKQLEEKIENVNLAVETLNTKVKLLEEKGFSTLNLTLSQNYQLHLPPPKNERFNLSMDNLEQILKIAAFVFIIIFIIGLSGYLLYREQKRKKRKKRRSSRKYKSSSSASESSN